MLCYVCQSLNCNEEKKKKTLAGSLNLLKSKDLLLTVIFDTHLVAFLHYRE